MPQVQEQTNLPFLLLLELNLEGLNMGGQNYYTGWEGDEQSAYRQQYGEPEKLKFINTPILRGKNVSKQTSAQQKAFDTAWQAKRNSQNQAQQSAYYAALSNAQNLGAQGQQAAQQQLSSYNQIGSRKDTSRAAINNQAQIRPVSQAQSQGTGQPSASQQQTTAVPKGSAQVNPSGAQAAAVLAANQIGANQNQFTLPSSQGIQLGGS
jgi:hypothetical protein